MKKKVLIICCLAVAIICTLTCCTDKPLPVIMDNLVLPELSDNQIALIVNKNTNYVSYVVNLDNLPDNATATDLLQYLQDQSDLTFTLEGTFLSEICGIVPDYTNNEYLGIYTNIDNFNNSTLGERCDENGIVIGSATVGVCELPLQSGKVIYVELTTW